jgi:hypothetical protein
MMNAPASDKEIEVMGTGCGIGDFIHFGTLNISGACQRCRDRANGDIEDTNENNRSHAIHRCVELP